MKEISTQLLNIRNLVVQYPDSPKPILRNFSLTINHGEHLGLIGNSGSGKTTLAKLLVKLLPNKTFLKGEVILNGTNIFNLNKINLLDFRRNSVGYIFQDSIKRLNPLMTIGDHLYELIKTHNTNLSDFEIKNEISSLFERIGIHSDRYMSYPHEFSGGMRQRIGIAFSLALKPKLIIADEPTSSLDVVIANQIMEELINLCNTYESTLLLISHDLVMSSKWCKRLALLEDGEIVEERNIENIVTSDNSRIAKKILLSKSFKKENKARYIDSKDVILKVSQLRCWLPKNSNLFNSDFIKVINELSFNLYRGEILGIAGFSGSGKSTLCKALKGLVPIKGGHIQFISNDQIFNNFFDYEVQKSIQMIFQDPFSSLNPTMNIYDAIKDSLLIHGKFNSYDLRNKIYSSLSIVGLNPPQTYSNKLPSQLSGGQQQRVSIARAIVINPQILICDESLSMLDSDVQSEILDLLFYLKNEINLSIIFITHDLSLINSICDRILIMHEGELIDEINGSQLFDSQVNKITKMLINSCPHLG